MQFAVRLLLSTVCFFSFSHVNAALFEDDEARRAILDLRQKTDLIQARNTIELKKINDDNVLLRRSLLDLSTQIESLRGELAAVRGQNEQLTKSTADIQRLQKDIKQGVDERLRKFEPVKVTVEGKEFLVEPAEKSDFEAALTQLRSGEFLTAQISFSTFIKKYPQSGYNASALFWVGNAQYALRNYREAVTSFRAVVVADPVHPRAAEALLSTANCQIELKDPKSARKTLEDLIKAYPQSEAASVAKERIIQIR